MKEIKKQCGYLDQKGEFHKTLFECNNANIKYRISTLEKNIDRLLVSYIRRFKLRLNDDRSNIHEIIEKITRELIVHERINLIKYGEEIASIKLEIEKLCIRGSLSKIFRKDWWVKKEIIF